MVRGVRWTFRRQRTGFSKLPCKTRLSLSTKLARFTTMDRESPKIIFKPSDGSEKLLREVRWKLNRALLALMPTALGWIATTAKHISGFTWLDFRETARR